MTFNYIKGVYKLRVLASVEKVEQPTLQKVLGMPDDKKLEQAVIKNKPSEKYEEKGFFLILSSLIVSFVSCMVLLVSQVKESKLGGWIGAALGLVSIGLAGSAAWKATDGKPLKLFTK